MTEPEPEEIGGYQVRTKLTGLGPIVQTKARRRPDGTRTTNFESTKTSAIPPELTQGQRNLLAVNVLARLLHNFVLPELGRRLGRPVSEQEVLSSAEEQSPLTEALVMIPPEGPPTVLLNGETRSAEVPAGWGHARLQRSGYTWSGSLDWTPLFPERAKESVRSAVEDMASAILSGDEALASAVARQWFPNAWDDSPGALRDQMGKEVFVILFQILENGLQHLPSDSDPVEALFRSFPEAVESLKNDYSWESLSTEAAALDGPQGFKLAQGLDQLNHLFSVARLTRRELRVIRLEAALHYRGEGWRSEDKERYLEMRHGTYAAALHSARTKIAAASTPQRNPYRRLLEAMLEHQEG